MTLLLTLPTAVPDVNAGEGWLILRVALPRLARRLDRLHDWLDRYAPERLVEAADELRSLGGSEGLAVLAAVPPDRRGDALDKVELADEDRQGLRVLADRLGDPDDERSAAAGLLRMVPRAQGAALEVPGDDARGVVALLAQARQAHSRGEYRAARDRAERALDRLRSGGVSPDRALEGDALNALGIACGSLGEPQRAIELFEQRLAIAREVGDRASEGKTLGNLGNAYQCLGQHQLAIELHEQRLVIAREVGDRAGEGRALGNLGNAYRSLGQHQRAIELFVQYIAIAREVGDRSGEAIACWNCGRALVALGRIAEAIPLIEDCVAYEREIGHPDAEEDAALVEELRHQLTQETPPRPEEG